MNPMKLWKLQNAYNQFKGRHPKFPMFLEAVAREGMRENTIIEIRVTSPEGRVYDSSLKLCQEDLELFQTLKELQ